ncbi:MAG: hypothetical protein ABR578_08250 [Chromatocurvus sp.]
MSASSTIDPDQVTALNRLIREKTGRLDGGPERERIAAPRKNLWLQMPPATRGKRPHSRARADGPGRSASTTRRNRSTAETGHRGKQVRQGLTLLLGTALLVATVATAATALDLLSLETGAPTTTPTTPTTPDPALSAPPGRLQPPADTALAEQISQLRHENARLRKRLQTLDSSLQAGTP